MEQNKVRTYLLYAVGEIALVMIGILLALQVNNWNEHRIERNLEERYLQRLAIDIERDIENLSGSIDTYVRRKERAEFLMAVTESPVLVSERPTYFVQSIEYAGYTNDPAITDHTFEEIKSSGNLSILRNEDIRTALSAYYSSRYNRNQYNFIRQDFQLKYLDAQQGILSPQQQIDMGSFRASESYSADEAEAVYQRMMKKPAFIARLPYTIQSKERTLETLEYFHDQASQLKILIRDELERGK